ncbi:hypothetical protein [Spirosoma linguale]|uniref:Uncharacterized protein n=1 Tax=Spirosoma linguale (strain ATCC 33905 / DSM 74 / LMG 10896 / Claus 1) TaxID=504472 RepID=D2QUE1_SPILD|nr:hypothetical protein Slin_6466 [Spirosoma linguale DSM 74]
MKAVFFLVTICLLTGLAQAAPDNRPTAPGLKAYPPELINWLKAWEQQVNRLSYRVDSTERHIREQTLLAAFQHTDTLSIPDLRQPLAVYRHTLPRVTVSTWITGLANSFWEDAFLFRVHPVGDGRQLRTLGRSRQKVQLQLPVQVNLSGILHDSQQPHHLRDEWYMVLEATNQKGIYQDFQIRSIQRIDKPVEVPNLTIGRLVDYEQQLEQNLIRILADPTRQGEALLKLQQLIPSDSVRVLTSQKSDALLLGDLLTLKLPVTTVARCRVVSFDISYCDNFFQQPDQSFVGQLTVLEGVSPAMSDATLFRHRRNDIIPVTASQVDWGEPVVTLSNVVISWENQQLP